MNRAEADCNAVPCIDRSNAQCQIDQFRFGEMLTRLVVDAVGKGFEALLAFLDCEPAGFALFHPRFSTWLGRPGVYLEDLFVTQAARGKLPSLSSAAGSGSIFRCLTGTRRAASIAGGALEILVCR